MARRFRLKCQAWVDSSSERSLYFKLMLGSGRVWDKVKERAQRSGAGEEVLCMHSDGVGVEGQSLLRVNIDLSALPA